MDSFKIEGRMKSIHYIATIVSTYRKLIDAYCADPDNFVFDDFYANELEKAANRQTSTGFFYGIASEKQQLFNLRDEHPTQEFVIRVLDYDKETRLAKIEQRNYFKVGQIVEFFSPNKDNFNMEITEIYNEKMEAVDVANHPMEVLYIKMSQEVSANDMARKVK
ncbi:MAG: U32 family peptidase C-terminal domain-containing protein [Bacteroidaceae bacterium]|nr:U32 family peptidase C-terminal domain-containing protein [Bacteroidaceae bacterium]